MKKILGLFIAGALASALLTGCSGKTDEGAAASTAPAATTTTGDAAAPAAAAPAAAAPAPGADKMAPAAGGDKK